MIEGAMVEGDLQLVLAETSESGPVAVVDGSLVMDISVVTSDDDFVRILQRGRGCPCSGSVLLTSSVEGQNRGKIVLVQGLRALVEQSHELASLPVSLTPHVRGLPQIHIDVSVDVVGQLCVTVSDMLSAKKRCWRTFPRVSVRAPLLSRWRFSLADPQSRHQGYTFKGQFVRVVESPVELTSFAADGSVYPEATAGKVWPCGYHLASHLVFALPAGVSVLELGAGQGLVGMAISLTTNARVICTDLEENLPLLSENLRVNNLQDRVGIAALDWRCAKSRSSLSTQHHFDAVVAADCVFWPDLFEPFLECLAEVLPRGSVAYLALVHRQYHADSFMARLGTLFSVSAVDWQCGRTHVMSTPRLYLVHHRDP
eukprot:TRINITY_DN26642_c0_g1_i1.p1 TRINITY_DN26642_c0_g1~~TRINITY_DN26642_c0_g1_i1.p1  ORF type:complete len:371 (-),score=33.68 TRINITY_DN26642_c0_g1_i1:685-1797(-)